MLVCPPSFGDNGWRRTAFLCAICAKKRTEKAAVCARKARAILCKMRIIYR